MDKKEYLRRYYQANKEKLAEHQRAYYQANKEKVAEYQRAYYQANKEKAVAVLGEFLENIQARKTRLYWWDEEIEA